MSQDVWPLTNSRSSSRNANPVGVAAMGSTSSNAEILAKVILDIKAILDIEKALGDDLDFGGPRNQRSVQDQILLIMDQADAVGTAERIQAGYSGLKVVK